MKKRMLAMALVLVLVAALCPAALAAGKLSTPTDLQWGVERYEMDDSPTPCPGAMSWRFGENNVGMIRLTVYRNNQKLCSEDIGFSGEDPSALPSDYCSTLTLTEILAWQDIPLDGGTYYFTVQNITDWDSTSSNNSAVATSPTWTYTKPSAKLAAPTDPVWNFPYSTWQSQSSSTQWQNAMVHFYYSKTKNGEYKYVSSGGNYDYNSPKKAPIDEYALNDRGAGYYKFRVMDLSRDITQWQNSDWSAYSEPYYYDGSPVDICHHDAWDYRNEKDATCTEDGYSGDYICADCGEVVEKGEVIPAAGHSLNSDGSCWRCGRQIELYGSLGTGSALDWTYSTETNTVTLMGSIPSGDVVYAACFQSGRFVGAKAMTAGQLSVTLRADLEQVRLIWLDSQQGPRCPAEDIPLNTL